MSGGLSPRFDLLFAAKLFEIIVSLPRRAKGKKIGKKDDAEDCGNC